MCKINVHMIWTPVRCRSATVSSAITTTDPGLVEDPPLSGGGVDEGNAAEDLTAV